MAMSIDLNGTSRDPIEWWDNETEVSDFALLLTDLHDWTQKELARYFAKPWEWDYEWQKYRNCRP